MTRKILLINISNFCNATVSRLILFTSRSQKLNIPTILLKSRLKPIVDASLLIFVYYEWLAHTNRNVDLMYLYVWQTKYKKESFVSTST